MKQRFFEFVNTFAIATLLALTAISSIAAAEDETGVDAVTSASLDATTGASQALEPVAVSGDFSVAYALNDDGALFIQARDLADAYHRDELMSDSIFKDKDVVVRGVIEKTSKPDAVKPWITLIGDDSSGKKIRCSLKKGQLAARGIEPGGTVQVRGICDGLKLSVSLSDGEIID